MEAPKEPEKPNNGCLVSFLTMATGFGGFVIVVSIEGALRRGYWFVPVFMAILEIVLFASIWFSERNNAREIDKWERVKLPEWRKAIQVWMRLEYHPEDDMVYDPKTNRLRPVSKMNALLYPD